MTGALPPARAVVRPPFGEGMPHDVATLAHHERVLRRRTLTTAQGAAFLVDLPRTTRVEPGDCFELADGRLIEVVAAEERLLSVTGADLARLAWHVGNRHAPCEIGEGRLLVPADPVMRRMLEGLGAVVEEVSLSFNPEGGAYGEGGVMGHSHGHGGEDPLALGTLGHDR